MKEAFYGMEYAEIRPERETDGFSGTLREMYERLGKAWCAETCAPRMRGDWTPENRTLGQCSVTAFLVQDYFGGTVYGIPLPEGGFHCYNVIGGQVFDLTDAQFGKKKLDYGGKNPEQFREVHFRDAEKQERYLRLKARFRDA